MIEFQQPEPELVEAIHAGVEAHKAANREREQRQEEGKQ